jgi:tetratricopeptide (TPR) repeat protein
MDAVRGCIVFAAALFAAGCAGPRVGRSPAEGGHPWIEIRTAHYTLQTDLSPDDARDTALYLERTRSALLAAAWPHAQPPEDKIKAFVLRDDVEFQQLFEHAFGGIFLRHNFTQFVLFYGRPANAGWFSQRVGTTLKHELTHHLSAYFLRRQPHWLSEGIASYMETLEISDDGESAVVGFSNPHLLGVPPARAQDILAWTNRAPDVDGMRLYAGSWLLVHWMMNRQPEKFGDFQQRLNKGEEAESAWKNAFPETNLDRLNDDLRHYSEHGQYRTLKVRVPPVDTVHLGRTLEDAEVHAIRAHLVLQTKGMFKDESVERIQFARREVDEALRQDSGNVSALLSMSELQPQMRESLARRAVAAHPESDAAWLMLAEVLKSQKQSVPELENALKKATSLAPQNAIAANDLAWLYVSQAKFLAALPLSKRALQLAPWSSPAWDTYASVAYGLKNCVEAAAAERRALELIPERSGRSGGDSYVKRLQSFQTGCQSTAKNE